MRNLNKSTENKLFLYEAVELRNEYDRHIKLLYRLTGSHGMGKEKYFSGDEDEHLEPVSEFNRKETEEKLKKLQTKRVKLNQEIQITNFKVPITCNGEKISIAEGLERRKNLISEIDALAERVRSSAFKSIIHKEERDIIKEPKHSFNDTYKKYREAIRLLRKIQSLIHVANHSHTVNFKDEKEIETGG